MNIFKKSEEDKKQKEIDKEIKKRISQINNVFEQEIREELKAKEGMIKEQQKEKELGLRKKAYEKEEKLKQDHQQELEKVKKKALEAEEKYKQALLKEENKLQEAEQKRAQQFKDDVKKLAEKQDKLRKKKQMKIICPHCNTKHQADYSEYIRCEKCAKDFGGFTYQAKKRIKKAIATTVIAGAVATGTHFADDYYYRYPTGFEYNIISRCSASIYDSSADLNRRIDRCTCALEQTMRSVPYYNISVEHFNNQFRRNLSYCR